MFHILLNVKQFTTIINDDPKPVTRETVHFYLQQTICFQFHAKNNARMEGCVLAKTLVHVPMDLVVRFVKIALVLFIVKMEECVPCQGINANAEMDSMDLDATKGNILLVHKFEEECIYTIILFTTLRSNSCQIIFILI